MPYIKYAFFSGAVRFYRSAVYNEGTGPIHIDDLECPDYAENLDDCTYIQRDQNCNHGEDVSVKCITTDPVPEPSEREYQIIGSNSKIPKGWRWATCEEARQDHDRVKYVLNDEVDNVIAELANGKINGRERGYRIMDLGPYDDDDSFGDKLITRGEEIENQREKEERDVCTFVAGSLSESIFPII